MTSSAKGTIIELKVPLMILFERGDVMEYNFLKHLIEKRGVRRTVIARKLDISERTLRNKLDGNSPFTWEQVSVIQREFFPDVEKDELFRPSEKNASKAS